MSDDWDGCNRNWDGTFNGAPGLPDTSAQRAAGVGPLDNYAIAAMRVEEQARHERHQRNGTLGSYYSARVGLPAEPDSGVGVLDGLRSLLLGSLAIAAIGVIFAGGTWVYQNRDRLVGEAEERALKSAFGDHGGFAPFEAYAEFVPRKARLEEPSTKKFIRELERTMSRPMSDPRRRALGAAAWKCVSERPSCLGTATAAIPGGASITLAVAEQFLKHARSNGSLEAVADLGMTKIQFDAPIRARSLAQAEWEEGIAKAPGAKRAKALLAKSKDFWVFRLLDGVAKLATSAKAALSEA